MNKIAALFDAAMSFRFSPVFVFMFLSTITRLLAGEVVFVRSVLPALFFTVGYACHYYQCRNSDKETDKQWMAIIQTLEETIAINSQTIETYKQIVADYREGLTQTLNGNKGDNDEL